MAIQRPKLLFKNLLEDFLISTITSEAAGFPKERLHDRRIGDKWAPDSGATQDIIIDAGAALPEAPDTVVFAGHNLGAEGATVDIKQADDAAMTISVVTNLTKAFSTPDRNDWNEFANGTTQRYMRIRITGHSTALRVGQIMVGKRYQFPRFPQNGFSFRDVGLRGRTEQNDDGIPIGAVENLPQRSVRMSFRLFTEAEMDALENILYQNGLQAMFFAPDYPDKSRCYLVSFPDGFTFSAPERVTRSAPSVVLTGPGLHNWTT